MGISFVCLGFVHFTVSSTSVKKKKKEENKNSMLSGSVKMCVGSTLVRHLCSLIVRESFPEEVISHVFHFYPCRSKMPYCSTLTPHNNIYSWDNCLCNLDYCR